MKYARKTYLLAPHVNSSAGSSLDDGGFVVARVELYRSKAVYPSKSLSDASISKRFNNKTLHELVNIQH